MGTEAERPERRLEQMVVPACRVVDDPTYSGRPRWSCGCGAALVRQPYMTENEWQRAAAEFFAQHGHNKASS